MHALWEGAASRAIQVLPLSKANYKIAVQIIEEQFGRPQQIISAHMEDLLKISSCCSDKTSHLCSVYDKIHINVRGLESLGVGAEQYGNFLIPVIMSKLPADVRLQVARITAKEVWEIQELLGVIKREVEAQELSDTIRLSERRVNEGSSNRSYDPPTASTLVTRNQSSNTISGRVHCIYCGETHYSASCTKIS